jgi:hypothetical protein
MRPTSVHPLIDSIAKSSSSPPKSTNTSLNSNSSNSTSSNSNISGGSGNSYNSSSSNGNGSSSSLSRSNTEGKDAYLNSELLDSPVYKNRQKDQILSLNVFIVEQHLKKTMKVSADSTVNSAMDKMRKHLLAGKNSADYGLFLPVSCIWLDPNRKLWTYLLTNNVSPPFFVR